MGEITRDIIMIFPVIVGLLLLIIRRPKNDK